MNNGEKIASLRKAKGMTQAELGTELNVTFQAVSKWERGESYPDFDTMSRLAKLFGVPLSYFEDNGNEEDEAAATAESAQEPAPAPAPKVMLGVCKECGKTVYEGDTAYIVPSVPEGKKIKSVTFNGQPMTYNESTSRYEYENVTGDGTIVITYEDAIKTPADKDETPDEKKGGCGGKAAVAISSLFALVAAAFVIKR